MHLDDVDTVMRMEDEAHVTIVVAVPCMEDGARVAEDVRHVVVALQ
jgi:hypothetical protein